MAVALMAIKGGHLLLIGGGGILVWSGLKGKAWTGVAREILSGGQPQATTTAYPIAGTPPGAVAYGYGGGVPPGSVGPGAKGAQKTALSFFGREGWGARELIPLIKLWVRESGWSSIARNPSSGAYGIAQALGHGTSCSAAANGTNEYGPQYGLSCSQARAANGGNGYYQILWGLGYIKSRYGTPTNAWAHEVSFGWY